VTEYAFVLLIAIANVANLVSIAPFSMTSISRIGVDSTVLIFTLLLSSSTAILFAWAPVFETMRQPVDHARRDAVVDRRRQHAGAGTVDQPRSRTRRERSARIRC
jgi:hypothetical protein